MSFIGNVPAEAYSPFAKDTFSGDGSTTAFTLSIPATTNGVEVLVENVQQEPTTAYTISGTTLTFTAAPVSGTNNIYVIHRGPAVQTVVPPAGVALNPSTVDATGDISTEGDLKVEVSSGGIYTITGTDTSSDRTLTLPDEAGTVLTSASTVPESQMFSGFANGITEADIFELTSSFSPGGAAATVITANLSRSNDAGVGTFGSGMSESSGVFTFPSTGYWLIHWIQVSNHSSNDGTTIVNLQFTLNNSTFSDTGVGAFAGQRTTSDPSLSASSFNILDITDTANQKVRFSAVSFSPTVLSAFSAMFLKIGDT
jgi:hypothetical protein